ncbi:WD40-like protein, partial [Ostertagia ostertagi]
FQLTHELGYDGGGFFSPDSKKIVYRASRPKTDEEIATYKYLLERDLIAPNEMELYVMNVDGSGKRPVFKTPLGQISWAPYYHPDNKRIIFSSNFNSTGPDDPDFNLYIVNEDGTGLEQVTFDGSHFDGFPMFSHDGKKLVWSSGRGSVSSHSQNVFIADWVDPGTSASDVSNGELERGGSKEELRTNRIPKKASQEKVMRWQDTTTAPYDDIIHFKGERHFRNVKQLTFGGQNAEGYFSYDDSKLTLQATGYGTACDQIYELDLNKDPRDQIMRRISTGLGTTTCSFFYKEPDNDRRLYAGNFWALNATTFKNIRNTCPAKKCANPATITDPVLKQLCNTSYTWDVFPDYDIFLPRWENNRVHIGFVREHFRVVLRMKKDGRSWTNVETDYHDCGYDGGIVRSCADVRKAPAGQLIFPNVICLQKLLEYNLVEPVLMELYVVDVDGSNMRQITNLSVASWAPYYLADNKRIVFSSNYNASDNGFGAFALFVINDDGTGLERMVFPDHSNVTANAMKGDTEDKIDGT